MAKPTKAPYFEETILKLESSYRTDSVSRLCSPVSAGLHYGCRFDFGQDSNSVSEFQFIYSFLFLVL